MNIVKTSQGYQISEMIENRSDNYGYGNYLVKMHYMGYSKKDSIKRFNEFKKSEKQRLNFI